MLVFLGPDAKRMEDLSGAVREYLAWDNIAGRVDELGLAKQQATQAVTRRDDADKAVTLRITDAYHWAIVPVQPQPDRPVTLDVLRADGAKDRLAERASDKLCQSDLLRTVQGARSIRYDLDNRLSNIWQEGHIQVGELWDYYCRYPYLPRLSERSVLDSGILGVTEELTWDTEAFAIATGYNQETDRFLGLAIPHQDPIGHITDQTLLVWPDLALAQRERERPPDDGDKPPGPGPQPPPTPPPPPPGPKNTRFFGVARISPERYARDLTRLSQEIIQHLAALQGAELEIRVEITAHDSNGYPDDKVRTVTENARTLNFETYGFEDR
jgi:hypothetical protein